VMKKGLGLSMLSLHLLLDINDIVIFFNEIFY
jgi:hypothetical protein